MTKPYFTNPSNKKLVCMNYSRYCLKSLNYLIFSLFLVGRALVLVLVWLTFDNLNNSNTFLYSCIVFPYNTSHINDMCLILFVPTKLLKNTDNHIFLILNIVKQEWGSLTITRIQVGFYVNTWIVYFKQIFAWQLISVQQLFHQR